MTDPTRLHRAVALVLLLVASAVEAQGPAAGTIKSASGTAFVIRAGRTIPAQPGIALQESDSLRTGAASSLGLTLRDGTRLSLGAKTAIHLRGFAFAPEEQKLGLSLRVFSGVLSYISGRIAALAPESITIETPKAVIGVRGTHLLVQVEAP